MSKRSLYLFISISFICNTLYADAEKQAWDNAVNAGKDMNKRGIGSIGFENFTGINSGLNSIKDKIGESTVNIANNSLDKNEQAKREIQDQYYTANSDKNFLYNQGQSWIKKCKNERDPACNAVTKYNDDDVQSTLNQYNMGTHGFAYNQYITPDPNNATCSIIHAYKPINSQNIQCTAGRNSIQKCDTLISPYSTYHPTTPPDGTVERKEYDFGPCSRANAKGYAAFIFQASFTKQNYAALYAYIDGEGFWGSGSEEDRRHEIYTQQNPLNVSLSSFSKDTLLGRGRYWGNGHTDATSELHLISGNGCYQDYCIYTFRIYVQSGGDGGCGDHESFFTIEFKKPVPGWTENGFTINDRCSKYKKF